MRWKYYQHSRTPPAIVISSDTISIIREALIYAFKRNRRLSTVKLDFDCSWTGILVDEEINAIKGNSTTENIVTVLSRE